MARLQLELPTLQNWNCHNCSGCCKQHGIFITEEEKRRIISQGWEKTDLIPGNAATVVTEKSLLGQTNYRLNHQADGSCIFLDERGLCKIHGKFGEDAKPLACRIYPYAFHPKGDKIAVSLRFSCPSVTGNLGTSVIRQRKEIQQLAEQAVPAHHRDFPAPKVTENTQLTWDESLQIVHSLDQSFACKDVPFTLMLIRALFWLDLVRQTNYKNIRGERLTELLDLLTNAAPAEVPEIPELPPPANVARMQFRLLAGQYARKDTYASMDTTFRGRFKQFRSAMKLSSGRGVLPQFHPMLPEVSIEALDGEFGTLPSECDELLTRYFRVKVQGMHFCGAAFYNYSIVSGFQALALSVPAMLWIARWRAIANSRQQIDVQDVRDALEIVDHQHGYSPVLGTWGARKRVSTIAESGNLERLILWYQR